MNIASSTRHLSDVRRFVEMHALASGFPAEIVEQFKLAVDEACTNVIKHAYRGEKNGRIDIAIDIDAERFKVVIRDRGSGFDPSKYSAPNIYSSIKRRKAGGYGIHLMKNLMDRVEYHKKGDVNEIQLIKFRNSENCA